uniref:DUF418 domain-containing protein n=1 Tax=Gelidibacter sp. TaxID=2018083 RepID=UPI00404968DE
MDINTNVTPIKSNDRIDYLDILRGIAILFIFTANIPFFSGLWFFEPNHPIREVNWASDEWVNFMMYTFVDGKFYTIFSLLFGIGCVIQHNNLKSQNKPFAPFFRKRMFWLLIFGLIHLFLIWAGDILTLYALLGFLLIWFVNKSNKTLLTTAVILILLPLVNWAYMHFTGNFYPDLAFNQSTAIYQYFGMPVIEINGQLTPNIQAYLLNTSVIDFFKMNLGDGFIRIGMILEEGRIFKVFGIFLIGIWTGRKLLNGNLLDNVAFLKKVLIIGLIIGLPFNIMRGYLEFYADRNALNKALHVLSYALGTVPLALAYAAGIALLCKKGFSFLNIFKPVGKMALTCYLSHSFISIIIFYGFGFNLTGKYGYSVIMLMAIAIFAVQVVICKLWLKHYKQGPMEWLWRRLSYSKK